MTFTQAWCDMLAVFPWSFWLVIGLGLYIGLGCLIGSLLKDRSAPLE